jgi:hypothetical protein
MSLEVNPLWSSGPFFQQELRNGILEPKRSCSWSRARATHESFRREIRESVLKRAVTTFSPALISGSGALLRYRSNDSTG